MIFLYMQKILIATHNKGKFIEICKILSSVKNYNFVSLADLGISEDVEETGTSFEENAKIKAEFFAKKSGLVTIADDSGIIIDALRGELGVKTRRWGAGAEASDKEWTDFFLKRMEKENNKKAQFVCNAAIYIINGKTHSFESTAKGIILPKLQEKYLPGLPLSAVFKPEGCEHVYSALSVEEKNKISHRGKAFSQVKDFLQKNKNL